VLITNGTHIGDIGSAIPAITAEQATSNAEQALSATAVDHPTRLEYYVKDDNSVVLTHVVEVRNGELLLIYGGGGE